MLAQGVGLTEIIVVLVYLLLVVYLGFLGYLRTKNATDYLIAGRQIHPFVMALSYGATFISTSAIVGFGGVAGLFGMSTLSSQFHTVGTSIGRDVYEKMTGRHGQSMNINRIGIVIGIVYAVVISYYARESTFIARATAIFFGLCASAFLPAFLGGLYWKRMTKAGAISSMAVGFVITAFWLLLVKFQEAQSMGLVQWITGGKTSILAGRPNWDVVDPLLVALPLSFITAIVVSLLTKPPAREHIRKCFQGS